MRDVKKHLRPTACLSFPSSAHTGALFWGSWLGDIQDGGQSRPAFGGHLTVCLAHADCSPCGLSSKPYSHQSKRQHYRQCIHKDNKVWGGAIHSQSPSWRGRAGIGVPARQVPPALSAFLEMEPWAAFLLLSIYLYYLLNMCEALS